MASAMPLNIPLFYRILFLWVEPIATVNGAYLAATSPNEYLKVMTADWTDIAKTPQFNVIFLHVTAGWLLFALFQGVVLRVTSELSVWTAVLGSMLVSDAVYIYGIVETLGWDTLLNPMVWRQEEWFNIVATIVPLLGRLAFMLGIGLSQIRKTKAT